MEAMEYLLWCSMIVNLFFSHFWLWLEILKSTPGLNTFGSDLKKMYDVKFLLKHSLEL